MKKKSKYKVLAIILVLLSVGCWGQVKTKKVELAEDKYYNRLYVDAIAIYLELAKENLLDEKGLKKLANSYYFNADYKNAQMWYEEIFEKNPIQNPEYLYRYAQSLKSIGSYTAANKIMEEFVALASHEIRAKLIHNNKDYIQKIKDHSNRYDIKKLGINSEMSDYGATIWGSNIVFTSTRNYDKYAKDSFQVFDRLFVANIDKDGDFKTPTLLFKNNKTKFNESTAVFTKDGKTMYFTRNINNDKKAKIKDRDLNLKIYSASLKKNKWTKIKELPFNQKKYNFSHAALSPDEKRLYFSSDMPGSFGQTDIYYVTINEDGTYSTPVNLGESINTEGRETFPFVSNDDQLYFSSDGRPGLGGLDVFVATKKEEETYQEILNVGAPINTPQDDFAYSIDSDTRMGYFSSNRDHKLSSDDLYWFIEKHKIDSYTLKNNLIDKFSDLPVDGAKIILYDIHYNPIDSTTTDSNGMYTFNNIPYNKTMRIKVEKEDYLTNEFVIQTRTASNPLDYENATQKSVALEKRIVPVKTGDDLAKLLEIGNLYFDFEKYDITPTAALQLEKIAKLMQLYPEVKIEIKTYTDSRGTTTFNQKLSDNRYKSVINWLKNKGIDAKRLSGKGYGESKIINQCTDTVECTVAEHELNRRCEFIFTK